MKLVTKSALLFLIFSLACYDSARGQEPETSRFYPAEETIPGSTGLFDSDELLEISLRFDMSYFKRKKPREEYLDAILTFHMGEGDSVNRNIRLRSRGERRYDLCSFPPIRLNMGDGGNSYSDLGNAKNIKLVTHCNPVKTSQEYLFMEYLVYKLYNIVTDHSFRVRLAKINYIDTGKKGDEVTRYGFLIEPVKMVASRLNGNEVEDVLVRDGQIDKDNLDMVSMFQYMIGNVDWQLLTLHNMKTFTINTGELTKTIVIPYDFDYAGILSAYYAVPHETVPISTVKERYYLGPERDDESMEEMIDLYSSYRDQFMSTINDFNLLNSKYKKNMLKYLEGFFKAVDKGTLLRKIKSDIQKR